MKYQDIVCYMRLEHSTNIPSHIQNTLNTPNMHPTAGQSTNWLEHFNVSTYSPGFQEDLLIPQGGPLSQARGADFLLAPDARRTTTRTTLLEDACLTSHTAEALNMVEANHDERNEPKFEERRQTWAITPPRSSKPILPSLPELPKCATEGTEKQNLNVVSKTC